VLSFFNSTRRHRPRGAAATLQTRAAFVGKALGLLYEGISRVCVGFRSSGLEEGRNRKQGRAPDRPNATANNIAQRRRIGSSKRARGAGRRQGRVHLAKTIAEAGGRGAPRPRSAAGRARVNPSARSHPPPALPPQKRAQMRCDASPAAVWRFNSTLRARRGGPREQY
jgi:hypothetical protein